MGKLSVFEEALGGLVKKFKGKKAIEHGGAPVSPERDKMRIANERVRSHRRWKAGLDHLNRLLDKAEELTGNPMASDSEVFKAELKKFRSDRGLSPSRKGKKASLEVRRNRLLERIDNKLRHLSDGMRANGLDDNAISEMKKLKQRRKKISRR